jgi:PAS domain S-box-containing protein
MPETQAAESRSRIVAYIATAAVLLLLGLVLRRASWSTNAQMHSIEETAATMLAAVAGALTLVRFYSRRERLFLLIGVAFLGTAVLDGYHTVISFVAPSEDSAGAATFAPWSWLASRTFLALFLLRLSTLPRPQLARRAAPPVREWVVYSLAITLVLATIVGLTVLRLPEPYAMEVPLGRPFELVPAALLFVALVLTLRIRGWKRNVFEHWLVLSLILGFASALFMANSGQFYDRWFDAAHVLKAASYACVLVGLLMSVFFTYRRLEESRRALASANVALQREIDERGSAERELRIRTAYLEQLIESAPEAIVVVDERGTVHRANAEFTAIFGYTRDEVVGRTITELIVQSAAAREADAVARAVASGLTVSYESVRRRKDGSTVDVSILATPIRGAEGDLAIYGIYRDITDRKRAEQARRESGARLEAIVQASPLGIVTLDAAGSVRTWNPAAERMLGQAASEVLGRPLPRLADDAQTLSPLDRALEGEPLTGLSLRRDDADLALSTAPLHDADGDLAGTLLVLTDVTDQRRAEETLRAASAAAEQANRAKSAFLASMSHELRTPLNSVIGFTRVLLRNRHRNLSPTELAYLERIAANGEHLLGVINDILDLSKIEAGRIELDCGPTDLGPLVQETVAQFEPHTAADVRLITRVPDPLLPVTTDPQRLRQVLINLVGNAIKFTPAGTIEVEVEADPVTRAPIRIDVRDTGIGIADDRLEAIFKAFEQADRTTARRFGGTGLGLSISRGLCRQMGFQLTARSHTGKGSTFTVDLRPDGAATNGERRPQPLPM